MNFLGCSFQNSKLTQGNIHASRIENLPVICTAMFIWVIAGSIPFLYHARVSFTVTIMSIQLFVFFHWVYTLSCLVKWSKKTFFHIFFNSFEIQQCWWVGVGEGAML